MANYFRNFFIQTHSFKAKYPDLKFFFLRYVVLTSRIAGDHHLNQVSLQVYMTWMIANIE